jgi:hypothetical protein
VISSGSSFEGSKLYLLEDTFYNFGLFLPGDLVLFIGGGVIV